MSLYVLVTMIFFLVIILGLYFQVNNKTQIQNNQIEKIIKEYERDIENMDIIYENLKNEN